MRRRLIIIMLGVGNFLMVLCLLNENAEAFTLEDYSLVGNGNVNGFSSEFFSLESSEPVTLSGGSTSTSTTEITFLNSSSINIQSLIITFDGMANSTQIQGSDYIETSIGSGVFLNYVSFGELASGNSLQTILSLTASGNSSEGQLTSAKIGIYTIPKLEGPVVATPEPSVYLIMGMSMVFLISLMRRGHKKWDISGLTAQ